jgi:hypothetical protein
VSVGVPVSSSLMAKNRPASVPGLSRQLKDFNNRLNASL